MRWKFVLAKHGQIYEPASLSSSALTTDINIRPLQGAVSHRELGPSQHVCVWEMVAH